MKRDKKKKETCAKEENKTTQKREISPKKQTGTRRQTESKRISLNYIKKSKHNKPRTSAQNK